MLGRFLNLYTKILRHISLTVDAMFLFLFYLYLICANEKVSKILIKFFFLCR